MTKSQAIKEIAQAWSDPSLPTIVPVGEVMKMQQIVSRPAGREARKTRKGMLKVLKIG
ncbi:MAG: hypothetical protein HQ551_09660 [Desulfobacteraceae bacterium]|nr:hypothetical protein [Desulfobacteraceae bacterium]